MWQSVVFPDGKKSGARHGGKLTVGRNWGVTRRLRSLNVVGISDRPRRADGRTKKSGLVNYNYCYAMAMSVSNVFGLTTNN